MKEVSSKSNIYHWWRLIIKYHTQKFKAKANRLQVSLLQRNLKHDSVFFDVGANKGIFSFWACKQMGSGGCVHAFEPQPELSWVFSKIQSSLGIKNFFFNNFALSDLSSQLMLTRSCVGHGSASLINVSNESCDSIMVDVSTLDDYCEQMKISKLDFIKIDVEGNESKTIAGGLQTVQKFLPTMLIEMTASEETRSSIKFFKSLGYSVKMIIAGTCFEETTNTFAEFIDSSFEQDSLHADFFFYI